ncbi:DUF3290 domain-containing protein [Limosilactobacillus sp. RRLNB_1_1]|uniref:DUF3290 domain-containing protein n=1 Tax=Limosilactobacillus albertensis TaxID=2759752 RepID=A0A7W3TRL0_9LACO|nr:DUF3290 family protein [Limosilactobacillus albertensis]MBC8744715.1 DUF3290 domain-containing protein [Lactobacillus sp. Marseille-P7033]NGC77132.1 DUF3290 domain-containing protein [Limosilactobacillus reuteri]MBB1069617.1 DUF3290 domain-containing protein [Limosilactobacillus albertensis]MBB1123355.1 DUF3290 domain-containing protein [Limosilactobacillus albertensis]MCD7118184.1 DUF3290 domain-containing protein [Limosilactobacillus albertensis]
MTFYTISYLSNHQHMNQLFNYIAILIFAVLIGVMVLLYLRHRLITRYRDLGIIFFLLLLLFIGFQVTDMEKSTTQQSQTTQMIPFIKAVARDHNVSPQKVVVNSTTLTDGILVRIEDRDYRVNLSQTGDNYTLTRAHVVNHKVNLMK